MTSFAVLFNLTDEEIIKLLGHDGGEIVLPEAIEPKGRRGFHIQEICDLAFMLGFAITEYEAYPVLGYSTGKTIPLFSEEDAVSRLKAIVVGSQGVLYGFTEGCYHALINNYGTYFDPDTGEETDTNNFNLLSYYKVDELCNG